MCRHLFRRLKSTSRNVTYNGFSVMYEPLRLGSAIGNGEMRVILGRDGRSISVKVTDKDGNPVPGSYVLILPSSARSEPLLAAMLASGQADPNGVYSSRTLAPGKYYVIAGPGPVDPSPESISKLWYARLKAKEVEVGAGATVQVTLEPLSIE